MACFRFTRPGSALRVDAAPDESAPAPPAYIGQPFVGPGWYDSSWELRRGLDVREGLPGDAKLHEWLEEHCRRL